MCKMPAQRTLVCGNLLKKYVVLVRLWQYICVCAFGCVEILEPCVKCDDMKITSGGISAYPKNFFFIKHIGCAPFVCRPDQTPLNCWSVLLFSILPSWQTARPTRNWAARTHRPVSSWSGSYRHPGLGHHTAHLASDYWAHWMWLERSSWDIVSYL